MTVAGRRMSSHTTRYVVQLKLVTGFFYCAWMFTSFCNSQRVLSKQTYVAKW